MYIWLWIVKVAHCCLCKKSRMTSIVPAVSITIKSDPQLTFSMKTMLFNHLGSIKASLDGSQGPKMESCILRGPGSPMLNDFFGANRRKKVDDESEPKRRNRGTEDCRRFFPGNDDALSDAAAAAAATNSLLFFLHFLLMTRKKDSDDDATSTPTMTSQ